MPEFSVTCPGCLTTFELDPEKLPDVEARASCSVCYAVIRLPQKQGVEEMADGEVIVAEAENNSNNGLSFLEQSAVDSKDQDESNPGASELSMESDDAFGFPVEAPRRRPKNQ